MKRIFFIMVALALVIGLMPMALVGADEHGSPPVILYGTEQVTGDIYAIDVANGTVELIFDTGLGASDNPYYPNGNAFDAANNRLYYSYNSGSVNQLYFYDIAADSQTLAGNLVGVSAGATFYNGHYYYIADLTDDLHEVSFGPAGMIVSDAKVADITGGTKTFAFGDIVIYPDGTMYGSTLNPAAAGGEFFTFDVGALSGYVMISDTLSIRMQLAIGSDGVLYSHSAGTGLWYTVDPATGVATGPITFAATNKFNDIASGPSVTEPEPELYSICGFKYADWEAQLIPLPDWSIQLYAWNATAEAWALTATTTTDENGKYCFTDLLAGTYRVSETLKDGWDQIYPDPEGLEGGAHTFALPGGQTYGGAAIYGIGTTTAVGSATNDGNIYLIDPVANTQEIIFEDVWAEAGVGVGPWWYPNALAFDEENGRLYFSLSPNSLYFYDVDTAAVVDADPDNKFSNAENVLGATFAGGSYWYVLNQSDKLIEVTVDSDGFVTAVSDPITMGSPVVLSQGDIVYDDGVIYGSSGTGAGGGSNFKGFFSFDTSTDVFTVLYQDPDYRALQLAWGMLDADGNKVLYGHQVENGTWYTIDLDPYAVNQVMDGDDPFLTDRLEDIASAIQPKYYNFINTPELICEGETAWAAEAHPGEQRFSNANNWATYVGYTRGDGTEDEPKAYPLYAGQHYLAGMLYVYNEGATLYVRYTIDIPEGILEHCLENGGKIYQAEGLCAGDWTGFLEYHLHVAEDEDGIPRTTTGRNRVLSNPIPGNFAYKGYFDPAEPYTEWIEVDISGLDTDFVIAAHSVMQWCGYDCEVLQEIEDAQNGD